jgi:DNA modification methylase
MGRTVGTKKPQMDLRKGDCLELMQNIPDGSIDAVITDPPYGTTACKWDSVIPFDLMWEQLSRIIKPNGSIVLFGSQPFTSALIMSNPKMFKYSWVWEKSKATGFLNSKIRPLVAHEDIVVFAKKKPPYQPQMTEGNAYNKGVRKAQTVDDVYGSFEQVEVKSKGLRYPRSVQYFKTAESEGKTYHKTQKPLELCNYIIKTYTNENETVLDFTMGSGTTMLACKNLNRNGIGIEKDPQYYAVAVARVDG